MKSKIDIPFEEKELEDPKIAVESLLPETRKRVEELSPDKLKQIVLYTLARVKELYHIKEEDKALCFILKNTAKAFGEEELCEM